MFPSWVLAAPFAAQVVVWVTLGVTLGAGPRLFLVVFPLIAIACYFRRLRRAA